MARTRPQVTRNTQQTTTSVADQSCAIDPAGETEETGLGEGVPERRCSAGRVLIAARKGQAQGRTGQDEDERRHGERGRNRNRDQCQGEDVDGEGSCSRETHFAFPATAGANGWKRNWGNSLVGRSALNRRRAAASWNQSARLSLGPPQLV